jgi:hypothetical protein
VNYFAHGRRYTEAPYFLAGTAVPDWLSVVDRRVRVRLKAARDFDAGSDAGAAAVAGGIVQHLVDDDWFHRTRAFAELSWQLTAAVRDVVPEDDGLRPRFLGHVLVEILLDAALISDDPGGLDAYFAALGAVDPRIVERTVNRLAQRPTDKLAGMIEHFTRMRILSDYLDDEKLWARLNQVMRRARLTQLPRDFLRILPGSRTLVAGRRDELLEGEAGRRAAGRSGH